MSYREVRVLEIKEVLRRWCAGAAKKRIAAQFGLEMFDHTIQPHEGPGRTRARQRMRRSACRVVRSSHASRRRVGRSGENRTGVARRLGFRVKLLTQHRDTRQVSPV